MARHLAGQSCCCSCSSSLSLSSLECWLLRCAIRPVHFSSGRLEDSWTRHEANGEGAAIVALAPWHRPTTAEGGHSRRSPQTIAHPGSLLLRMPF